MHRKETEIVRMLASFLHCEQCNGSISAEDIGLVGQKDGWWFFMVHCSGCGGLRVVVVLVRDEVDLDEMQSGEAPADSEVDVTWDDVLDMHLLLSRFQGDFRSLLK